VGTADDWVHLTQGSREVQDPGATQTFFRAFQSEKGSRTVAPAAMPIPTDRPDRSAQPAPSAAASGGGTAAVAGAAAGSTASGRSLPSTGGSAAMPALAGAAVVAAALTRLRRRGEDG
jgi:LPXTG-motif cell wall-anchored protein